MSEIKKGIIESNKISDFNISYSLLLIMKKIINKKKEGQNDTEHNNKT